MEVRHLGEEDESHQDGRAEPGEVIPLEELLVELFLIH